MINRELALKVADAIEQNEKHFDMKDWLKKDGCNTVACVAGWTLLTVFGEEILPYKYTSLAVLSKKAYLATSSLPASVGADKQGVLIRVKGTAQELLGLTSEEAEDLFQRDGWPQDINWDIARGKITQAQGAAILLRRLAGEPETKEQLEEAECVTCW